MAVFGAAFLLSLVLTVSFVAHGTSPGLKAGVEHKVQLQDDSIWKEVLGHKAYQQYESSASHKTSETTTTETVKTTASVATTSSRPSPHSSSSSSSASSSVSSALTTTPRAHTEAPRPGLIISTNAQEETQRAPVSNGTDADRISKMDDVAKEFMSEASKLDPDSAEHHSLKELLTSSRVWRPPRKGLLPRLPCRSSLSSQGTSAKCLCTVNLLP